MRGEVKYRIELKSRKVCISLIILYSLDMCSILMETQNFMGKVIQQIYVLFLYRARYFGKNVTLRAFKKKHLGIGA